MTAKYEVYKCEICGNIIEVFHSGRGTLKCCGKAMSLLATNTEDAAEEKHVPVMKKSDGEIKVSVGEFPHPMEEKHYIEWVEIIADGKLSVEFLKPGQKPDAIFCSNASDIKVRAYCNLHGLWRA